MRTLLIAVVGWLALAGVGRAAVTQFWKFDDTGATTTIVATTGTNATSARNASTMTSSSAPAGGSISASFNFVPNNDEIDISASSLSFASGSAFSFSACFNVDSVASSMPITGRSDNTAGAVRLASSTTIVLRNSVGTDYTFTVPTISTGTWYHLFVTKTTGNSSRLWLNGTESSTGALTYANTYAPTRIGRTSATYLDGKIAYVRFFDSDESANVATYYAEAFGGGGSTVPRQAIVVGSLARPYQPTDIDWRCNPFAAFFGALAP